MERSSVPGHKVLSRVVFPQEDILLTGNSLQPTGNQPLCSSGLPSPAPPVFPLLFFLACSETDVLIIKYAAAPLPSPLLGQDYVLLPTCTNDLPAPPLQWPASAIWASLWPFCVLLWPFLTHPGPPWLSILIPGHGMAKIFRNASAPSKQGFL